MNDKEKQFMLKYEQLSAKEKIYIRVLLECLAFAYRMVAIGEEKNKCGEID